MEGKLQAKKVNQTFVSIILIDEGAWWTLYIKEGTKCKSMCIIDQAWDPHILDAHLVLGVF